jgi:hypothetical protein
MQKKSSNNALRVIIGAGSVLGFLGGWIVLGNASSAYTAASEPAAIAQTLNADVPSDAVSTDDSVVAQPTVAPTSVPLIQIQSQTTTTTVQSSSTARTQTRLRTGGS